MLTEQEKTTDGEHNILRNEVRQLREENAELEERVEKLENIVEQAVLGGVEADIVVDNILGTTVTEKVKENEYQTDRLEERLDDLESQQRVSDSEPSTKTEKVRDWIVENFDDWSVSFQKGQAVATDASKGSTQGLKKNVTRWVKDRAESEQTSVQYKTIYDAMKRVERDYSGYEYEEVERNGETKRFLWRVEQ